MTQDCSGGGGVDYCEICYSVQQAFSGFLRVFVNIQNRFEERVRACQIQVKGKPFIHRVHMVEMLA